MATSKLPKDALGKGIRSLLQNIDSDLKTTTGGLKNNVVEQATSVIRVPLDQIQLNPKNPRKDFDDQSLLELANSIKTFDIVQPLTVSKTGDGHYQLIAGERRYRAAKIANIKDVPVYIRQANDNDLLELALLENLQREDLNAIEIAISYKRMMDELGYTQEQVSDRMGKERSTISNYIRLLKLPPDIQLSVRNGGISMGHARALINIEEVDRQLFIFHEIQDKNLSVRQTEELVRNMQKAEHGPVKSPVKHTLLPAYKRIEDNLASHFGTKVKLSHNTKGAGSISIEYYSLEELNKLLEMMNVQAG